ncbi:MAG: T9SS type A sorting domain-containing protein [Bacteroidales bacterium]|nr:T9SS type A sorting domain-containing protein [Bacteroidales bacterium]
MKRTFTLIIVLFFSLIGYTQENVTLVKWTFPNDNLTDTLVESYSELNGDATLGTIGGTGAISMKNGLTTKAAQADGWNNGMNSKAWRIFLNTTGYENIKLNSVQQSGNTDPGPKDFKVQVKIGEAGDWTDIPNGLYEVANDWTTGALIAKPLPEICNDQPLVYVRWVMASNLSVAGSDVLASGKTKIDDVMVTGDVMTGVDENPNMAEVTIYPNPNNGTFYVNYFRTLPDNLIICNTFGQVLFEKNGFSSLEDKIELANLSSGVYLIKIVIHNQTITKRLLVN